MLGYCVILICVWIILKAISKNGEHIDAALTDLKSKWQIVHDAQFQLSMKQLTIDNEKDALANKVARIDSQVNWSLKNTQ